MSDDFAILAGVAAGPAYPYQLLEFLNARGLRATRSTLYRRVDGLVAEGALLAREVRGERGHLRRTLELTAAGLARLGAELRSVLRDEPLESPFFGLALDCVEAARVATDLGSVFRERLLQAERRLAEHEQDTASADEPSGSWGRAARERHIAHIRTDIIWMREALGRAGEGGADLLGIG